ncbi:TPA: methyltransferase domain-containing protein [Methanosarcina acetivorans]|uniref:Methyltransferase domain-containing protein n=1 Tax=Methanosarcina acetivorans TaxID=2214 RepID=A0A832SB39_9EURY|nr:methyltransferase domain-containing protein [Methanosarcina acetivorans]HIH93794.1 methyltransferase domain-containing protein [Methanosarcina acetivorans]
MEAFYDGNPEYEWRRLEIHRIEYETTRRYLDIYLPKKSRILDVGGGPGRYSIYLASQGHNVTLFDLSSKNILLAKAKAEEQGVHLEGFIHGNALELDHHTKGRFDAILCMGPSYHLTDESQRHIVIDKCVNVLKPGGILFVSFISAFAPIIDMMKGYPHMILDEKDRLLDYLKDGTNIVSEENPGFTDAWFENPANIEGIMKKYPLEKLVITAIEGMLSPNEGKINSLPEDCFNAFIELSMKLSTNPMTWGSCEHMLYIGRISKS